MADDPLLLPTVSHFYLKIMSLDPLPLYFSINENLTDGSRWCIVDKYWISTLRLLLHGHFIFQNVAHFHEKISKSSVLFVCWCGKKIHMKIKVLVPCGTKCQSINHWNQYLLVCFREWQFKVHKKVDLMNNRCHEIAFWGVLEETLIFFKSWQLWTSIMKEEEEKIVIQSHVERSTGKTIFSCCVCWKPKRKKNMQ